MRADPIVTGKLWRMAAHLSGNLLNMENLSGSLGIHAKTVRRYLDFMESAYLIRKVAALFYQFEKRLVKTPKLYISGYGNAASTVRRVRF